MYIYIYTYIYIYKGHFQIPAGMVVRDGRRQSWTVHVPSCVAYVTKDYFISVERTLAYLEVGIILVKGVWSSCRAVVGLSGSGIRLKI